VPVAASNASSSPRVMRALSLAGVRRNMSGWGEVSALLELLELLLRKGNELPFTRLTLKVCVYLCVSACVCVCVSVCVWCVCARVCAT
jgi:hypothetical protein